MITTATPIELPKVLPVLSATITIPDNLKYETCFKDLVQIYKDVATLLSYVSESNTCDVEYDDDWGWTFITSDVYIIKYATDHGFLNEFCTVVDTLAERYGEDLNDDEFDELLDSVLESDYRVEQLSDGKVYLILQD